MKWNDFFRARYKLKKKFSVRWALEARRANHAHLYRHSEVLLCGGVLCKNCGGGGRKLSIFIVSN